MLHLMNGNGKEEILLLIVIIQVLFLMLLSKAIGLVIFY